MARRKMTRREKGSALKMHSHLADSQQSVVLCWAHAMFHTSLLLAEPKSGKSASTISAVVGVELLLLFRLFPFFFFLPLLLLRLLLSLLLPPLPLDLLTGLLLREGREEPPGQTNRCCRNVATLYALPQSRHSSVTCMNKQWPIT